MGLYTDIKADKVHMYSSSAQEILHNHDYLDTRRGDIHYQGYSEKNPSYHLFKCIATSRAVRSREVVLEPFNHRAFTVGSKAWRGGCSMPGCLGEAVQMNVPTFGQARAYCVTCVTRQRNPVPCPWTTILPCARVQSGRRCATCVNFEEVADEED